MYAPTRGDPSRASTSTDALARPRLSHRRPFSPGRWQYVRRLQATPLQDSASVDGVLTELAANLASLEPHFGSRAVNQLLERAVAQFPATDAASLSAVSAGQAAALQLLDLLPKLPALPSSAAVVLQQRVPMNAPSSSVLQSGSSSAGGSAGDMLSGASAGVAGLTDGVAATAAGLQDSAKGLAQQLTGLASGTGGAPLDGLQPHFGSESALRVLQALQEWAAAQAASAAGVDAAPLRQAAAALAAAQQQLQTALAVPRDAVAGAAEGLSGAGLPPLPSPGGWLAALQATVSRAGTEGVGGYDLPTLALVAAGVFAAVAASAGSAEWEQQPPPNAPRLPNTYSAEANARYWQARPAAVAARAAVVASEAARWGLALAYDVAAGQVDANAKQRAAQLRGVIERLGPAYIKLAQALSTRVDLLSGEYLVEIERLQDRVPVFDTQLARDAMARAFGAPVEQVCASISPRPIAAASLGQVYRATLSPAQGGGEVAVKVRRPGLLEAVSLDLHLMRMLAVLLQRTEISTNWPSVIDEWAARFFDELDYTREAANAELFKAQLEPLCEGILVPQVYTDLCSHEVLTTVWVEGEKLSESNASDVRQLCSTLLSCYLIQLLDTGLLHADPHPGNLIRTPDGRIAILDYGLVTRVTPQQSMALTEYIAHLSVQDWQGVADDLVNLGFIPDGVDAKQARLIEPLSKILEQLSMGGGAANVNIDLVSAELNKLSRQYPIQVPAYFALILRAFSVIEGIALRVDPQYAIVSECFPYLSRRLLTDNHPRSKAVLRELLYGNKRHLDLGRLQRMATGFSSFTVSGLQSPADQALLDSTARDALRVVFSTRGSYVQELLVEELAAAIDALSREALSDLFGRVLRSAPAALALRGIEALGPWRSLLLPLPTPLEVMSSLAPVVAPTSEDEEALNTIRGVFELVQQLSAGSDEAAAAAPLPADGSEQLRAVVSRLREVQPLLPELLPGIAVTGQLFVQALLRRVLLRLADELGPSFSRDRVSSALD